ncbi:MAG: acetyltransferase [Gammaproteobacteria bacterium]|nr:MAG: acetyltransferase [Gammaproteobacteria bacterium]
MEYIDVFNGDADGLCALVQLRLAQPRQAQLVTGIKRDINLLKNIEANNNVHITVLDISLAKNNQDVLRLLAEGASIDYIDHHQPGEIIKHEKLSIAIEVEANTCTSLIVDKRLNGQYREWAITAAFGDNLLDKAMVLGWKLGLSEPELTLLKQLGILLNYNGYGASISDLFFDPADLFQKMKKFDSPFEFIVNERETFAILERGYRQDMALAKKAQLTHQTKYSVVIIFPNEAWARRVSGVYGNELANGYPDRAHAVVTRQEKGGYTVSVRAPLNRKQGADELVSQFPTGGGRKAAAGINHLPEEMLEAFILAFEVKFQHDC